MKTLISSAVNFNNIGDRTKFKKLCNTKTVVVIEFH